MSKCCNTDNAQFFGIQVLPNSNITYTGAAQNDTITENSIEYQLRLGTKIIAIYKGPKTNSSGDGFLSLITISDTTTDFTYQSGIQYCQANTYCDCNGCLTTKYSCTNQSCCNDNTNVQPCLNPPYYTGINCEEQNPCNPCNQCDNPYDNPCGNPYDNHCDPLKIDPIYAYLQTNPYNVIYPSSGTHYSQSIKNPFTSPTPYLRRYNACNPSESLLGTPITSLNVTGYFPPTIISKLTPISGGDPVLVTVSNLVSSGNIDNCCNTQGETDSITFNLTQCGNSSTQKDIPLIMGIQSSNITSATLNFSYSVNNNIPTWTLINGFIDFSNPNTE
jgi:hypothetical protein